MAGVKMNGELKTKSIFLKTVGIVWVLPMCMVNASLVHATRDERELGAAEGYPIGNRSTFHQPKYAVGSYSHACQVYSSRPVPRGGEVHKRSIDLRAPGLETHHGTNSGMAETRRSGIRKRTVCLLVESCRKLSVINQEETEVRAIDLWKSDIGSDWN
jgi:hypothetical protein